MIRVTKKKVNDLPAVRGLEARGVSNAKRYGLKIAPLSHPTPPHPPPKKKEIYQDDGGDYENVFLRRGGINEKEILQALIQIQFRFSSNCSFWFPVCPKLKYGVTNYITS